MVHVDTALIRYDAKSEQMTNVTDHLITWLARTITNTGVEPGSPASVAIPSLQKWTGGHEFDPAVGRYWE